MRPWRNHISNIADIRRTFEQLELSLRTTLTPGGDLVAHDSSRGLVLRSPNGTYWRATISNAGTVTWSNIGTTAPT